MFEPFSHSKICLKAKNATKLWMIFRLVRQLVIKFDLTCRNSKENSKDSKELHIASMRRTDSESVGEELHYHIIIFIKMSCLRSRFKSYWPHRHNVNESENIQFSINCFRQFVLWLHPSKVTV